MFMETFLTYIKYQELLYEMNLKNCLFTIGIKQKGGINDEDFLKYFKNSLVPLYPDLKDEDLKCVMLKVDSFPWVLN